MRSFADLVHALSWRIAAEVASSVSQSFVAELHLGGGMADELVVRQRVGAQPGGQVVVLDRTGTLRTAAAELAWGDVVRGGTAPSTTYLLQSVGLSTKRRPTTPTRRTYRLVAELLELRLPDAHQWAVRSAMLDTAGYGSGVQQTLLLGRPELAAADPYQVWTVLCDGMPVLALNEGVAYYPDGYRLTLMELPSTAERQMADYLLQRVPGI